MPGLAVRARRIGLWGARRLKVHANIVACGGARRARRLIPGVLAAPVAPAARRSVLALVGADIAAAAYAPLSLAGARAAALRRAEAAVWLAVKRVDAFASQPTLISRFAAAFAK